MTHATQRYFGDWVEYDGYGDVGYYLGCCFVRMILTKYDFGQAIQFDLAQVSALFEQFIAQSPCDAAAILMHREYNPPIDFSGKTCYPTQNPQRRNEYA